MHTLEHFLAGFMREKLDDVIDISPMGCKTGFYLTSFGDIDVKDIIEALEYSLSKVLDKKRYQQQMNYNVEVQNYIH